MSIRVRLSLLFVLALTTHALWSSTAGVNVVGNCKPNFPSYATISAALAATPAPVTVQVCPGIYPEQIVITQPVTLEGITVGNSNQAVITVPASGLATNASQLNGNTVAAQLWVNNASGPVNLSDLVFDGSGSGNAPDVVAGIFYQNSPGTISRVATRNQMVTGFFKFGIGMLIEGGASVPSVTIENSSVHDFSSTGIEAETFTASSSELNVTMKSNDVNASGAGISLGDFVTATLTGNWVTGTVSGLTVNTAAAGTASGNTFTNTNEGVSLFGGAFSVVNNRILNATGFGVGLFNNSAQTVQNNSIIGGPVGIDFQCFADGNIHSNTFTDVATALSFIPSGVSGPNTYFNVAAIRSPC